MSDSKKKKTHKIKSIFEILDKNGDGKINKEDIDKKNGLDELELSPLDLLLLQNNIERKNLKNSLMVKPHDDTKLVKQSLSNFKKDIGMVEQTFYIDEQLFTQNYFQNF